MNLTQAAIARLKLPAGKSDAIFFDDKIPGFGIRLRAGGSQSWVFQYKFANMHHRMVLGKVSAMKPEAARKIAEKHHAAIKDGRNPATERAVRTAQAANTFGQLVGQYMEFKRSRLRPRSLVEVKRHLEVCAKPLHKLPVVSIDKTIVAHLIKRLAAERGRAGKPAVVTANRVRASLSALFAWALKETDFAEQNPVINTHDAGKEESRTRVLENDEIRIIWNALEDDDYSTVIKLLLLTGQRLNEIVRLRWDEVDFERNRIALPPSRTKNGRAHHVPMSETVRLLLEAQKAKRAEGQGLVFARGDRAFAGWADGRRMLDRRIAAAGATLSHWTNHDLRRTCATRMAEDLQVQPHVVEAILNHVGGHKAGVAGVYNLASYMPEKAAALQMWDTHVAAIAKGCESNVVSLRA
jgi:integrase